MTESSDTKQPDDEKNVHSFGEHLYVERKRQNLTVADVAMNIHLSEKVIDAIDRSDVEQLPQPTFVQGYLRSYARYLGISDTLILEEYARAVPHKQESDLQPRSTLPSEASSNSPFVKIITILLLVVMIVAAVYASFSYYKNAIVEDDAELDNQPLLTLPEEVSIDRSATEHNVSSISDEQTEAIQNIDDQKTAASSIIVEQDSNKTVPDNTANQKKINQMIAAGDDSLDLSAVQVSWVEVDDANGEKLFYDLLPQGQSITLKGKAPFKVFLGNAPQVEVKMNDVLINIEKYIRSNNIAHFSISVDQ